MSIPNVKSSGLDAIEARDKWVVLLKVPGTELINWISVVNEGDTAGLWKLVDTQGNETDPARLPCGGGDLGHRRAAFNIPCKGFAGELQVKAATEIVGDRVWGLFAFGMT